MTPRLGAILGLGNVAYHGHLPAWQRRTDVRIVAVADVDSERRALAARQLPRARLYDDPVALLDRERLDFVDIATPPARHAPLILQAAGRRSHVLCEKPLVTSLRDLSAATHAARDAHVVLCAVHNWKQAPQYLEATRLLNAGAVGKPLRIRLEVERMGQSVTVNSPWRTDAAQAGGGILFDHGWHNFYLLLGLARERPLRVTATTQQGGGEVEDTAHCVIEFATLTGEIHLTWAGNRRYTAWQVEGEEGSLEIDEDELRLQRRNSPLERRSFPAALSAGSHHPDWFDAVIDEFFAEIDGTRPRGANLREASLCLTLIQAAYESAVSGRAIDISPVELAAV